MDRHPIFVPRPGDGFFVEFDPFDGPAGGAGAVEETAIPAADVEESSRGQPLQAHGGDAPAILEEPDQGAWDGAGKTVSLVEQVAEFPSGFGAVQSVLVG